MTPRPPTTAVASIAILALAACSPLRTPSEPAAPADAAASPAAARCDDHVATGRPLFGDLHVHTSFSFDAAANTTGATPDDAQRYARGEPIPFWPLDASGAPVGSARIDRPLDFLAVTDHGEFLGERAVCRTPGSPRYDSEICRAYRTDERGGMAMLASAITTETPERNPAICGADGALCADHARTPWREIQRSANEANAPCEFTSFVAYEYTGTPQTSNYHRNVIFRGSSVPALPVSYVDAPFDSELWARLDEECLGEAGCDYLTIPHNTNLANGRMAPYRNLDPTPESRRAYAATRLRREPIMEIFQHKGGSECVDGLSSVLGPPDELCDVEQVRPLGREKSFATTEQRGNELVVGRTTERIVECEPGSVGGGGMLGAGCVDETDFQRSALLVGLREEQATGLNPIKLGIIAATDTHTATPGAVAEDAWGGAVSGESSPVERLQPSLLTAGIDGNPGGLAGVWATENTRDAIFDAMLRREVFGTSGPRIVPRLFAGFDLPADACARSDWASLGIAHGVPMGGDLASPPPDGEPRLLAYAAKDPHGRDLRSLELVKGWVDADGAMHAEVVPVAESEGGAATLCALHTDERFDPGQSAYYYLRVVEVESPRWHTYDCARIPEAERPAVCGDGSHPETIHEMAWTSPIWYRRP